MHARAALLLLLLFSTFASVLPCDDAQCAADRAHRADQRDGVSLWNDPCADHDNACARHSDACLCSCACHVPALLQQDAPGTVCRCAMQLTGPAQEQLSSRPLPVPDRPPIRL
jgi:hypothetical protein